MTDESKMTSTVAELVELVDRTRKSLCEAGEPELAERAHITIRADGSVRMSFCFHELTTPDHPVVNKALSIDPLWEKNE